MLSIAIPIAIAIPILSFSQQARRAVNYPAHKRSGRYNTANPAAGYAEIKQISADERR